MSRLQVQKPPNYLIIIIIALCIGGAVFALWYMHVEPVYSFFDNSYTYLTSIGAGLGESIGLNGVFGTIQNSIAENPVGFGITAITGVGAVWGIISKIRAENMQKATEEAANKQMNELDNYYKTKLTESEQRLDGLTNLQTKITDLETQLADKEGLASQVTHLENKSVGDQQTITNLMKQIEELKMKEKVIIR